MEKGTFPFDLETCPSGGKEKISVEEQQRSSGMRERRGEEVL